MKSSQSAHDELTGLYCFIWPTLQSYKIYKDKIVTYSKIMNDLTKEELHDVFAEGFEHNQIDFKKAVIEPSYEEYSEKFAHVLLTNIFAIYEGWVAETCKELNCISMNFNGRSRKLEKALQFPSDGINAGVMEAVNHMKPVLNSEMYEAFGTRLSNKNKYSLHVLNDQMKCYRVFKEIRNDKIHNNGVCSQKLKNKYADYKTITSPSMLNAKEVPFVEPQIVSKKVRLDIRGVVGLSDIILRIITTIDAEIASSEFGLTHLVKEWKNRPIKKSMKHERTARIKQFGRFIQKIGFPVDLNCPKLHDYFEREGLLKI